MEEDSIERFLGVGRQVMVEFLALPGDSKRIRCRILGWDKASYVLIDCPSGVLKTSDLVRGEPCIARLLYDGDICGFRTKLVDAGAKTCPQFRLCWPEEVEILSLRRYERVKVAVPCLIEAPKGGILRVEMHDLSVSGCGIHADKALPVGGEVRLSLRVEYGVFLQSVKAIVKNVTKIGERFDIGLQFVDPDETLRNDLEFFIAARIDGARESRAGARRVLLIGEDVMKQDTLRERLESQGATVAAAGSLVDAFHLVRSWGPDAVVVDARVSELKGVEVCRILREARGCERLPTIVFDEQRRQAHEEEGEKNWVSRYCSGLESVVNAFEELSSDPSRLL